MAFFFFFHIGTLGHSGLVLGGILPLSETQEWPCVLESVTRASSGTELSSQWAKSQLWRELSLYSHNPIGRSFSFLPGCLQQRPRYLFISLFLFVRQIWRCTSSTRRWTCRICLSRRTRPATAPSSSRPPPSSSTVATVSRAASLLHPSILPSAPGPPGPSPGAPLKPCTVPRRPAVCLHLHFRACLKQSACS